MQLLDWIILCSTLLLIVAYGTLKTKGAKNSVEYIKGGNEAKWWTVGLSVMATQASAITFLSTPGQAFNDGMGFVQFYFGLPIAIIIICIVFIPIYHKLKVFTAYEYLESRFDLKTRTLTSLLFLIQRSLAAGITIFAPAIILSSVLGWDLTTLNIIIGLLVIIYTVSGGTKAVNYTQKYQMGVIFTGLIITFLIIIYSLPENVTFEKAIELAGANDKMKILDFSFDLENRYTVWSGILGGTFLMLSYFGTDQSQVQRYLSGKSLKEMQMGMIFNGILKIPMQFLILLLGVLLFTFYQFKESPIFFNKTVETKAWSTPYKDSLAAIQDQFKVAQAKQLELNRALVQSNIADTALENKIQQGAVSLSALQKNYKNVIATAVPGADVNDTNYIFLRFVVDYLPVGLVGLLIAVIFLAAWGSIAAALNALASCTVIDFHLRYRSKSIDGTTLAQSATDYKTSKWYTLAWGVFCILTAQFATGMGSLIEAVNVLGSLFYGVILGIFLVAFYAKKVGGTAVFWAAIVGEIFVIVCFCLDKYDIVGIGFLCQVILCITNWSSVDFIGFESLY